MCKYLIIAAITATLAILGCTPSDETPHEAIQSRSYAGHENDRDIRSFVLQYPEAVSTRLDDCQTCHRGGIAGTDTEREYSPCGYCHLLAFPNARYSTGVPDTFGSTLNAYGLAYKENGRNGEALLRIAELDSDSDGFANGDEIAELYYPGNASSQPGQPLAPTRILDWDHIQKLLRYSQFMLMNRSTQQQDIYTAYSGVRIRDLLEAEKVDLSRITGITVFAPDGYSVDYTIEEVLEPFPKGYFYTGPGTVQDGEQSLVQYSEPIPPGIADGGQIPDVLWLLLAFEQNGSPLEVSRYESGSGRLVGEGPYRMIQPQSDPAGDPSRPGRPDRSMRADRYGDGWDYDGNIDHNAVNCVRGATVIRLNPMPEGFEEYDWKNGWPLVDTRQIILFGRGID